ncbi:hypothetical protein HY990_04715 [Candidatus Micrarchaeota archaeon]|nr:hypothetical protein [Candidatus Micrarchaeota archaeon]
MEFDELLITTGVDALVRLVKERQKVELEEASKALNISTETIEDWSRILEEEGILRIEYRLTKICLVWIKPTEEDIAEGRNKFETQKTQVIQGVEELKGRIEKETDEIKEFGIEFTKFHEKIDQKLAALEKISNAINAKNGESRHNQEIERIQDEIAGLRNQVGQLTQEVRSNLTQNVGREKAGEETITRITNATEEIKKLQIELSQLRKNNQEQKVRKIDIPDTNEVRKKYEQIKKEFLELKTRTAKNSQDMRDVADSATILKDVADSIIGEEQTAQQVKVELEKQLEKAQSVLDALQTTVNKAKKSTEMIERFQQTTANAKGIFDRLPDQKRMEIEVQKNTETQIRLEEKIHAMDTLLDEIGGGAKTQMNFNDLEQKIEERINQARSDLETLTTALEEDKATYFAFQKIRDKITTSLEAYQKQMDTLENEARDIERKIETESTEAVKQSKEIEAQFKQGDMKEVLDGIQGISEKRKTIEEIIETVEQLDETAENLTKKISLLSKEAKLLEIRTDVTVSKTAQTLNENQAEQKTEEKAIEVKKQIELTESEELEFRRKREELKKLIKKLWEDEEGS